MAQLQPFVLVRNSTKPLKIFSPVFTRYSLPPRLWSLQTSLDPNRGKVSVEPAAGSNPGPDCRRPAGLGSHTREISVAISNSHIITHKAPLLMLWRGRGGALAHCKTDGRFRFCNDRCNLRRCPLQNALCCSPPLKTWTVWPYSLQLTQHCAMQRLCRCAAWCMCILKMLCSAFNVGYKCLK